MRKLRYEEQDEELYDKDVEVVNNGKSYFLAGIYSRLIGVIVNLIRIRHYKSQF